MGCIDRPPWLFQSLPCVAWLQGPSLAMTTGGGFYGNRSMERSTHHLTETMPMAPAGLGSTRGSEPVVACVAGSPSHATTSRLPSGVQRRLSGMAQPDSRAWPTRVPVGWEGVGRKDGAVRIKQAVGWPTS